MLKLSVTKTLFENILLQKMNILEKNVSKYWQKELIEVEIIDDKLHYNIKKIPKINIINGLGKNNPKLVIECKNIIHNAKQNTFEFHLGKILEQKNTYTQDYKDILIQELISEKEELKDNMNRDHLTGVFNRRKMEADLSMFIKQNNSHNLAAVFVDADRFKGINDNFGHDTGDRALIYLGNKLKKHAKLLDGEVYRYGGEEFIILCFVKKELIVKKLDILRIDIKSQNIYHPTREISMSVSMGVAFFYECASKDELIKKADNGVYKAKENGRDRIEFG